MTRSWVISDTHFGHSNIITFKREDGTPLRDFPSVEAMDEALVDNWNSVVKDGDTVYHLGDVAINRKALSTLGRLKGRKILIKGNHDIFKIKDYLEHFEDVRAYKVLPKHGIIMSHIPIHPQQLYRFKVNVHGHLHSNRVRENHETTYLDTHTGKYQQGNRDDPRYINVSVEQINYTPINLETILELADKLSPEGSD